MAQFDNVAWLQAKAEEAQMRIEVANATTKVSLPLVYMPTSDGDRAAAPSPLLWGSLFSVLPRVNRSILKNARLGQSGDLVLRFTGERLGQDDLDVFLVLIRLSQNSPLGTPVKITGASLLTALGLTESPRELRRLQPLRRWSHEQEIKQVFPGSP